MTLIVSLQCGGYRPNSDMERRLMTGRAGPKRKTNPITLIKYEWDQIHKFKNFFQQNGGQ